MILAVMACPTMAQTAQPAPTFESDVIKGDTGDIKLTFIGHATLVIEHIGKVIHIDPWSQLADYSLQPKADMLLITHEHRDHLDLKAVEHIKTSETAVVYTEVVAQQLSGGKVMNNGDTTTIGGIQIEAVPAYNIVHKRENGEPYHPKGRGNGYILNIDGKRIYIAGDTENVPELKELKNIDVAFLPMNLPYTMTPEMVADLATSIRPKILYPYHFSETDTSIIVNLLRDEKDIEVRIRDLR
jgi:L-ascorbate metabolism protein UlaG (beta-lactamase superfamily)